MFYFAKLRAARRTHMLRPFPARFIIARSIVIPPIFTVSNFPSNVRALFIRLFEAPDQKIAVVRQHLSGYANQA